MDGIRFPLSRALFYGHCPGLFPRGRRASRPLLAATGLWLGRGQWLPAGLDAVENVGLIYLLLGSHNGLCVPLA